MQKLYMSFGSDHGKISRAPQRQIPQQRGPTPQQLSRAQGKQAAIRSMGNVYAKKAGGGCGSCGGAK